MFSFGMTLDYSKAKGIDFSFTAQSDNFLLGFNKLSYKQVELKSEQNLLKRNLQRTQSIFNTGSSLGI